MKHWICRNAAGDNPKTELLFDEFDLDPLDRVVYSIICCSEQELSITFKSFSLQSNAESESTSPVRSSISYTLRANLWRSRVGRD